MFTSWLLTQGKPCEVNGVLMQVIGLVGSSRKRTLMLWQAVELSRMMQRPDLATLQIARKALEPPDDPLEQVAHPTAWSLPKRDHPTHSVQHK